MPVTKCSKCGRVSNIEVNSPCLSCGEMIFVKSKQAAAKDRKIISSVILAVLVLGLAAFGAIYFISTQREKARVEAEKKPFAAFDMISFKADAASVSDALKSVPTEFNVQPPYTDLIKRNVNDFETGKQMAETKKPLTAPVSVKQEAPRAAPTFANTATLYSVIDLQPLQFDYIKATGNRLACFVTYQAKLAIYEKPLKPFGYTKIEPSKDSPTGLDLGKKVGEREVKETAHYIYETGGWKLIEAGINDIDRIKQIDKIRIEAKTGRQ